MSDSGPGPGGAGPGGAEHVCSARGCREQAQWALLWNNPSLHTPERRKTWLACDEHRESLGEHLRVRGFLRQTVTVDELGGSRSPGQPVPPVP